MDKRKGNTRAARRPKGLTLADVTVTWQDGDKTRSVSGDQLAGLLTAAERIPSDHAISHDQAGQWIYRLRGLSALVFPDAGTSIYEGDARGFVSDMLETAAACIAADQLATPEWAAKFAVKIRRGAV